MFATKRWWRCRRQNLAYRNHYENQYFNNIIKNQNGGNNYEQ